MIKRFPIPLYVLILRAAVGIYLRKPLSCSLSAVAKPPSNVANLTMGMSACLEITAPPQPPRVLPFTPPKHSSRSHRANWHKQQPGQWEHDSQTGQEKFRLSQHHLYTSRCTATTCISQPLKRPTPLGLVTLTAVLPGCCMKGLMHKLSLT
jgi:hypothetical protein